MLKFLVEMSRKIEQNREGRGGCVVEKKLKIIKRGIEGFISQPVRGLMGCNGHCACLTGSTLNAPNGLLGTQISSPTSLINTLPPK